MCTQSKTSSAHPFYSIITFPSLKTFFKIDILGVGYIFLIRCQLSDLGLQVGVYNGEKTSLNLQSSVAFSLHYKLLIACVNCMWFHLYISHILSLSSTIMFSLKLLQRTCIVNQMIWQEHMSDKVLQYDYYDQGPQKKSRFQRQEQTYGNTAKSLQQLYDSARTHTRALTPAHTQ